MQKILCAFFIALTNTTDSIFVRIIYSIKGIKIDINKNIFISIITFIMSTFSAFLGTILLKFISPNICNIITATIFIILGATFILEYYKKEKETNTFIDIITNPNNADIDNSKYIDYKEALFLCIALNLNNIGGSFSAGILGLNIYFIGILFTFMNFLALWIGNYLTCLFQNYIIQKKTTFILGLLLTIFGIIQFF